MGRAVDKKRAFEEWLQRRERLGNDFEGNKNMFWKELKRVRKGEQARDKIVKDVNGQILRDGAEVRRRWGVYFEQVLTVADVRESNINVVGIWRSNVGFHNRRKPVMGDLNERAISLEEVGEVVNEMKFGKAPGLDGFPMECLKKGGMAVLKWLVRLLNLSFDMGVVRMDGRGACMVPRYKRNGDKCDVATREVLVC